MIGKHYCIDNGASFTATRAITRIEDERLAVYMFSHTEQIHIHIELSEVTYSGRYGKTIAFIQLFRCYSYRLLGCGLTLKQF